MIIEENAIYCLNREKRIINRYWSVLNIPEGEEFIRPLDYDKEGKPLFLMDIVKFSGGSLSQITKEVFIETGEKRIHKIELADPHDHADSESRETDYLRKTTLQTSFFKRSF